MRNWTLERWVAVISCTVAVIGIPAMLMTYTDWFTRPTPGLSAVVFYGPIQLPPNDVFEPKPVGFVQIKVKNPGTAIARDVRLHFEIPHLASNPPANAQGEIVIGDLHPLSDDRIVNVWLAFDSTFDQVRDAVRLSHEEGIGEVHQLIPLPEDYSRGNPFDKLLLVGLMLVSITTMVDGVLNRKVRKELMERLEAHDDISIP